MQWPLVLNVNTLKRNRSIDISKTSNVLKLSLSCDHRVVDGAIGSEFLQTLKNLLENPVLMLV
jgi:pyruvate dehydrogenase E2 component (dihydrolipoamide acetyltransferase)